MRIEGGVLDGTYASVEQADPSSLERRAASDRITIGAGTFRLDGGLTLRLAGIDLDLPLGTLLGPDARGELGLPDDFDGPATASPGGDGEPGDGDLVVVADDDNLPPIVYALTDIEIETGEDGDAGAPGAGTTAPEVAVVAPCRPATMTTTRGRGFDRQPGRRTVGRRRSAAAGGVGAGPHPAAG